MQRGESLGRVAAFLLAAALLAAAQIPHVWGLRADRRGYLPDRVYAGYPVTYADEASTYLAWIRQAREGRFFLTDRFTPEEHPRNYVNLLVWSLGGISAVTGLSELAVCSARPDIAPRPSRATSSSGPTSASSRGARPTSTTRSAWAAPVRSWRRPCAGRGAPPSSASVTRDERMDFQRQRTPCSTGSRDRKIEACEGSVQGAVAASPRAAAGTAAFDLGEEPVLKLMDKYADVPMSLADACLVRASESLADPLLLTTDADFRIYRRHGRRTVPCVIPG